MKNTIINFYFIRHGLSCYNAIKSEVINDKWDGDKERASDPHLTNIGAYNSIISGEWLYKKINNNFDMVFSSPLIRAMETAQLMSLRKNKVFVVPYLRELDEHSFDKYSRKSIRKMLSNPAYKKISKKNQKKQLKKNLMWYYKGKRMYKFYHPEKYNTVGDIKCFIDYFYKYFYNKLNNKMEYNILIITHSGVLKDYYNKSFKNNDGFCLKIKDKKIIKQKRLHNPNISYIKSLDDICGENRCSENLNVCKN